MNPVKGQTPLKLSDGRTLKLVLDMEALVEAEAAYGKPLQQMMADAGQGFVGASRALLYGALRACQPAFTLREASAIFMTDPDAASSALSAAVEAGFPDAAGDKKPGKAKARNGRTSGASGVKPA